MQMLLLQATDVKKIYLQNQCDQSEFDSFFSHLKYRILLEASCGKPNVVVPVYPSELIKNIDQVVDYIKGCGYNCTFDFSSATDCRDENENCEKAKSTRRRIDLLISWGDVGNEKEQQQ